MTGLCFYQLTDGPIVDYIFIRRKLIEPARRKIDTVPENPRIARKDPVREFRDNGSRAEVERIDWLCGMKKADEVRDSCSVLVIRRIYVQSKLKNQSATYGRKTDYTLT